MTKPAYKRILLKLSGEVLAGGKPSGFDESVIAQIASEIKDVHALGVQIGIVIGGGNLFRGASADTMDRCQADNIGMLATMMNSLYLKAFLEKYGVPTSVMSAVPFPKGAEYFTAEEARTRLNAGTVVIIAGGTGNPFFTTDTAAALRCAEIQGEVLFKATKVDGVYDKDPAKNPDAKRFTSITHAEAIAKNLRIMDATALALCMENNISIMVFKLMATGSLRKCVEGLPVGTIVSKGE